MSTFASLTASLTHRPMRALLRRGQRWMGALLVALAVLLAPEGARGAVARPAIAYAPATYVFTLGTPIGTITPINRGGAAATWSISPALPQGLVFNPATGQLSGTPRAQSLLLPYAVKATNAGGSATTVLVIAVKDQPPAIVYTPSVCTFLKGVPIPTLTPRSIGGRVLLYSIAPGLPAGLAFNILNGSISGTPTALSPATVYTVLAANLSGTASARLTITIGNLPPVITFNPASYTLTRGLPVSPISPTNTGGPATSYTVAPALPGGLGMNTATGVITGTPTAVTPTAGYTITASNGGGSSSASLTLTVNDQAPANLTYKPNPLVCTKGLPIPACRPASTGGAIVAYRVSPGLPAGLALDGATGIISGTPTAVTAPNVYTVSGENSGGATSVGITITVNDVPPSGLVFPQNPAVYVLGSAIAPNVPSNAGGLVHSYSVSPALPEGLKLAASTNGAITGTPAVLAPTATYTVTAINTGGSTSVGLVITVVAAPPSSLVYSQNPAVYTRGVAITPNAPSCEGGAVTGYSITPPLPAGLGLDPGSGVISGTPTAIAATGTYTIKATNSGGQTTATLTLTVNDAPPPVPVITAPVEITSERPGYAASIQPQDGCSYAWSITNGTLTSSPAGTAISFTAGRSGTTVLHCIATNATGTASAPGTASCLIVAAPVIAAFTAEPAVITSGTGTILGWTASGAASLSLDNGIGDVTGQTSRNVAPTDSATYTLTARNALGDAVTAQATVTVIQVPVIASFQATPATIPGGTAATLGWTVSGASRLSIDHGVGDVTGLSSRNVAPVATTTYTLTAANAAGASVTAQATVTVLGGAFSPAGNLASDRLGHTATLLANGKILVAGGQGQHGYAGNAECYDPLTGTFEAVGSLLRPRARHTATLLPDGKVLLAGGYGASGNLAEAELFDPATGTFQATGRLNVARYAAAATLLTDGRVLIAGGGGDSGTLDSAEVYDPALGTFATAGEMTTPRFLPSATLLRDGKVLLAGGVGSANTPLDSAEQYDAASGTFTLAGRLTEGRYQSRAVLLPDGSVLIAGGVGGNGEGLASAERYDPSTRAFTATGSMGSGRVQPFGTLLAGGKVLFGGGHAPGTDGDAPLASTELYDPALGSFTPAATMAVARYAPETTLMADGKVLVAGGTLGTLLAETYDAQDGLGAPAPDASLSAPTQVDGGSAGLVASVPEQPDTATYWMIRGGTITSGHGTHAVVFTAGPAGTTTLDALVVSSLGIPSHGASALSVREVAVVSSFSATPPSIIAGSGTDLLAEFSGGSGVVTPGELPITSGQPLRVWPLATTTYTLTVTPLEGEPATRSLTVRVGAITLLPETLPASYLYSGYSQQLTASGGMAPYAFFLSDGSLPQGLSLASDGRLRGSATSMGSFPIVITARDSQGNLGSRSYTLEAMPPPTVTLSPQDMWLQVGIVGRDYAVTFTATGAAAPYAFSLRSGALPQGLSLSPEGVLSGIPTVPYEQAVFELAAVSADGFGRVGLYRINTYPAALTISPDTIPAPVLLEPYPPQQITVTGGTPPYTLTATLTQGMTLSASGVLSGMPTEGCIHESCKLWILATDAYGNTGSQGYPFLVPLPTITLTPALLPDAQACDAYSVQLGASGGHAPYTYAIYGNAALPPGLSLAANGLISGTVSPSATSMGTPRVYTVILVARDRDGYEGNRTVALKVWNPAILVLGPQRLPDGTAYTPYSYAFSASGCSPEYHYALVDGTLPQGMALSDAGALSGNPTQSGTFKFKVRVQDTWGNLSPVGEFELTIWNPVLTLLPASLPDAVQYVAYGLQFTGSGGLGPYAFACLEPPQGFTMTAGGYLEGTPWATGTYTFRIRLTDANQFTGLSTCTLTIHPPPPPVIASFTASPSTLHLSVGNSSTLAWEVNGADTIAIDQGVGGVTERSSATVYPTATTTYTLTATNRVGVTATAQATVTVVPAPSISSFTAGAIQFPQDQGTTLLAVFANGTGVVDPGHLAITSGVPLAVKPGLPTRYVLSVGDEAGSSRSASLMVYPGSALAAGGYHSLVQRLDGSVWGWGDNLNGQLGNGTAGGNQLSPVPSSLRGVAALAGGTFHTLALTPEGTVLACGNNDAGQLGDGTIFYRPSPVPVNNLAGVAALAGSSHSLALAHGIVWAWGANDAGQLGDGTTTNQPSPVEVDGLTNAVAFVAGQSHSAVLRSDGTVWTWGANTYGQLGDGTLTSRAAPAPVPGLTEIVALAGGPNHCLALKADGTLWAWGADFLDAQPHPSPVQVSGPTDVVAMAAGWQHSLVLQSDGTLWSWGSNGHGELGNGTQSGTFTPTPVPGLTGIVAIAAGYAHSLALDAGGAIWAWGWNARGQLGDGTTTDRAAPIPVAIEPVIHSFQAASTTLGAGDRTTLTAVFSGGTGSLDHGLGAVASGEPVSTGPLSETTRFVLAVTNPAGTSATASLTITVLPGANHSPCAVPGGPYIVRTWLEAGVRQGADLILDGSASTDPDSASGDSIVSYAWDLDGNGTPDATGARPTIPWTQLSALLASAGLDPEQLLCNPVTGLPVLDLSLKVTDMTGRSHTLLTQLRIYHDGPVPRAAISPAHAGADQPVVFDASASSHGYPGHSIVRYDWDFDLPAAAEPDADAIRIAAAFRTEAQGRAVAHAYSAFGSYHPVLRVTDDVGHSAYAWNMVVAVDAGDRAPLGLIQAGRTCVGGALSLDATGSTDPDAAYGDWIVRHEWDLNGDGVFGDASGSQVTVPWEQWSSQLQAGRDYPAQPRTWLPAVQVALRVTDTLGRSSITTATLPIFDRSPHPVSVWGPQPAVPVVQDQAGHLLGLVSLDASGSFHGDPGEAITQWTWRVPGQPQEASGLNTELAVDLTDVAATVWDQQQPVTRTLVLTVTDTLAQSAESAFEVTFRRLGAAPPRLRFEADQAGLFLAQGDGFTLKASSEDQAALATAAWYFDGAGTPALVRTPVSGSDPVVLDLVMSWSEMAAVPGLQGVGSHTLRLEVTSAAGGVTSLSIPLTLFSAAMVPALSVTPARGGMNTSFTFDAAASRHLLPGHAITSCQWDWNGDGLYEASGVLATHVYGTQGRFNAGLKLVDDLGHVGLLTVPIATTEGNLPPIARPGGPYVAPIGGGVTLNASGSTDPEAPGGDRIVKYSWDLDGVLVHGQRTWEVVTTQPACTLPWSLLSTLPVNQVLPVVLMVEDTLGAQAQETTSLLITDFAPVAAFRCSSLTPLAGQQVVLDASGSCSPVPGASLIRYEWDTDYVVGGAFNAVPGYQDIVFLTISFPTAGSRNVALRVTDKSGRSSIVYRQLSVQ